jgi:hypothetical protein
MLGNLDISVEAASEFADLVQDTSFTGMTEAQIMLVMDGLKHKAIDNVNSRKAATQAAKTEDQLLDEAHKADLERLEEIKQQRDNYMRMPEWKRRQDLELGNKMRALAEEERRINDGIWKDTQASKRSGVDAQIATLEAERQEITMRARISPQGGNTPEAKRLREIHAELQRLATQRHYGR